MGQLIVLLPQHTGKRWVYVLMLLTPGSFFVRPVVGLYLLIVHSGRRRPTFARGRGYRDRR